MTSARRDAVRRVGGDRLKGSGSLPPADDVVAKAQWNGEGETLSHAEVTAMTMWTYEVYVAGQPGDRVLAQIHEQVGEVFTTEEPARTLITGTVPDQSALIGLVDQLHALGLEVLELRHVAEPEPESEGEILRFPPSDPSAT